MDLLERAAAEHGDRMALHTARRSLTFAALENAVRRAVGGLRRAGVGSGDRVAIWAGNDVPTVVALWAIPRTGAMAVPLSTRLTRSEAATRVDAVRATRVVGGPGPPLPGVEGILLESLGEGTPTDGEPVAPDSPHMILFTSGTAGPVKGVLLTPRNFEASAAASAARLGNDAGDRWLLVLPLFHIGGLSVLWRSARQGGVVVLEPRFDPARAARLIASGRITVASLVPTMLQRILDRFPGPFGRLRAVLVGGGPVDIDLLERALGLGMPALQTYGMTETASQVATVAPGEERQRLGTAGRALPTAELRVLHDQGEAGPGEVGEIAVRGPMVSPGYLGGPGRAPGEWLHTGDVGLIDEDGYVTVMGRADDLIVTGGENVHPAEVEAVLLAHPDVASAVVHAESDAEWGHVVAASVVPAAGHRFDSEALEAFLRERLAGFKVPRRWHVVESLPPRRTASS